MAKKLYVGGVSYKSTQQDLQNAFSKYGNVISAQIITDRETGDSRGFGFVEMDDAAAMEAVKSAEEGGMNGAEVGGRRLTVNEAKPMEARSGSRAPRSGGYNNRDRGERNDRSASGSNDWGMN